MPIVRQVAAISVGIFNGVPGPGSGLPGGSAADTGMNVIMTVTVDLSKFGDRRRSTLHACAI